MREIIFFQKNYSLFFSPQNNQKYSNNVAEEMLRFKWNYLSKDNAFMNTCFTIEEALKQIAFMEAFINYKVLFENEIEENELHEMMSGLFQTAENIYQNNLKTSGQIKDKLSLIKSCEKYFGFLKC